MNSKAGQLTSPFFNWPGDSKHLGSAGQQAEEYIAPGGKFFTFFIYLILPMNQVKAPLGRKGLGVFWLTDY
jgi:hypothetical protein